MLTDASLDLDALAAQQAKADQFYGFPPGTMRAVGMSETTNGKDLGPINNLYNVVPTTAAKPGYGLTSVNGNDTMSVGAYLNALWKGPARGDMRSAMSLYQTGYPNPNYSGNTAMSAYLSGVKYQADPANQTVAANSNAVAPTSTTPTSTTPPPKPAPPPMDFDNLIAATYGYQQENRRILAEDRAALAKPPTFPQLAPPPPQQAISDPLQAFGQPAMWLAIFGSLVTRRPLTSAIQAAAGVLKGTQEQNDRVVQQNFAEWKVQSENAVKMAQFEQASYRNALEKYNIDARAGEAQFQTLMEAFQAASLKYVYDTEGMPGVIKYMKKASGDTALLEQHRLKLDEELKQQAEASAATTEWDANHPYADAVQRNTAHRLIAAGKPPDDGGGASPDDDAGNNVSTHELMASNDPVQQAQGAVQSAERDFQIANSVKGNSASKVAAQNNVDVAKALLLRVQDPDPTKAAAAYAELQQRYGVTGTYKPPTAAQATSFTKAILGYDEKGDQVLQYQSPTGVPVYRTAAGEERSAPKQFTKTPGLGEDAISFIGEMVAKGNLAAASGLARNTTDMEAVKRSAVAYSKANNLSPDDVNNNILRFAALHSEAVRQGGATGQRVAAIEVAANDAKRIFPLAKEAFGKLPVGQFAPLNRLKAMARNGTNSPEQKAAMAQDISAATAMARALSPTGVGRESEIATFEDLLSTASLSKAAHDAVLDQWQKDIEAMKGATLDTVDELAGSFRSKYGLTAAPGGSAGGGGGGGAAPKENDEQSSKSGRPMIFKDGQWQYKQQ